jgi:peptide/nickel transport system permease protein
MHRAVLNRLFTILPTAILGSMIIFGVVHLTPGGPAAALLGPDADPESIARVQREMGLDRPLYVQFADWVWHLAHLDLGNSLLSREPVLKMILERLPVTATLTVEALCLSLVVGIPLGIWAAIHRGSALDTTIRTGSGFIHAFPEFWIGMMLVGYFALRLYWFPPTGFVPLSGGLSAHFHSAVLPVCTLATAPTAMVTRFTRSAMAEALSGHYVRTAWALGIAPGRIHWRFALKNALIQIVTVIGLIASGLIGGAVLVERVFAMPGLGDLLVESVLQKDFPLIQGTTVFLLAVVVLINLAVDITCAVLDPRTRVS